MWTMNLTMALIGGLMIGSAGLLLWLLLGRIAGISGILANAVFIERSAWRWCFIAGLALGPLLMLPLGYGFAVIEQNLWLMAIGGFLVGFGSKLGGGCTSGHGVCGIGRLSRRSTTSVVVFMLVAGLTVFVSRHLVG